MTSKTKNLQEQPINSQNFIYLTLHVFAILAHCVLKRMYDELYIYLVGSS